MICSVTRPQNACMQSFVLGICADHPLDVTVMWWIWDHSLYWVSVAVLRPTTHHGLTVRPTLQAQKCGSIQLAEKKLLLMFFIHHSFLM